MKVHWSLKSNKVRTWFPKSTKLYITMVALISYAALNKALMDAVLTHIVTNTFWSCMLLKIALPYYIPLNKNLQMFVVILTKEKKYGSCTLNICSGVKPHVALRSFSIMFILSASEQMFLSSWIPYLHPIKCEFKETEAPLCYLHTTTLQALVNWSEWVLVWIPGSSRPGPAA